MRQKHLEIALSSINHNFVSPRVELEQYSTPPDLAACVTQAALQNGDLGEGITVCDLGCGTGVLSIAAALVGCDHVISIDVCKNAIRQAHENAKYLEVDHKIDFIQTELCYAPDLALSSEDKSGASIEEKHVSKKKSSKSRKKRSGTNRTLDSELCLEIPSYHRLNDEDGIPLLTKCVDTVLTNPPFGTKQNPGIDVTFLATACRIAKKSVYSFHKTSTRKFLIKKIEEEWNLGVVVVAEMKFSIPNMYKFHKKKSVDVSVDLIHIWHLNDDDDDIIPMTDDNNVGIVQELGELGHPLIEDGTALAPIMIKEDSDNNNNNDDDDYDDDDDDDSESS